MAIKIYVASSLHNSERVKQIIKKLVANGASITYDWTTHGQVFDQDQLRFYGEKELQGVLDADVFFLIQPGRFGSHVELGIALAALKLGQSKTIIILDDDSLVEKKTFYYLDCVHNFNKEDDAIQFAIGKD